ncbi:MAG: hypothetical protein M3H12_06475 [Chromatiales bacterium]|nr:hypothetical protein [Gammaproteobacteria bacterium]
MDVKACAVVVSLLILPLSVVAGWDGQIKQYDDDWLDKELLRCRHLLRGAPKTKADNRTRTIMLKADVRKNCKREANIKHEMKEVYDRKATIFYIMNILRGATEPKGTQLRDLREELNKLEQLDLKLRMELKKMEPDPSRRLIEVVP